MLGLVLSMSKLHAQDRKRTTISFEDELITGQSQKPELIYLLQRRQFNFKKLIKLRENFNPELQRSSELIPSSRKLNAGGR